MFDVVRGRSSAPTRLKPALGVSLLAHAALLAGALMLSRPAPPPPPEPIVKWKGPKAATRGGGGAPKEPPATPPKVNGRKPPRTVRTPLDTPRPADLPERSPSSSPESGDDRSDDSHPGPGGPGSGPECATPPCGGAQDVVSEDVVAEMPVLLSAPEIRLSPEARRNGVEGTVLVRCVITASGTVEACEVLKELPLADAAVLAALQGRRYRPAQIAGRAVPVHHNFTVKIIQVR